jgi:hypothetical protein
VIAALLDNSMEVDDLCSPLLAWKLHAVAETPQHFDAVS